MTRTNDRADKLIDNQRVLVYLSENENKKSYPQSAEDTLQKHHFHILDTLAKRKVTDHQDITLGSDEYRETVLKPIIGEKEMKRGSARLLMEPYTFHFLSSIFRLTYVRNGSTVKAATLHERLLWTQPKNFAKVSIARLPNTVGGVSASRPAAARAPY